MGEAARRKKFKIELPYIYYFSYVGTSRPTGSKFIGSVYLEAYSTDEAIKLVESLGLVPQGEPIETLIAHKRSNEFDVPERFRNRLLDIDAMQECADAMGDRLERSGDLDFEDHYPNVEAICDECGVIHQHGSQRH